MLTLNFAIEQSNNVDNTMNEPVTSILLEHMSSIYQRTGLVNMSAQGL